MTDERVDAGADSHQAADVAAGEVASISSRRLRRGCETADGRILLSQAFEEGELLLRLGGGRGGRGA